MTYIPNNYGASGAVLARPAEPFDARDFCACPPPPAPHAPDCYPARITTETVHRRDVFNRPLASWQRAVFPAEAPVYMTPEQASEPELVAILDTETTGLRPTARVCEIAVAVIDLVTGATVKRASMLLNPGVPIPPDATRVHGITDAMVESAPRFMEAWPRVVSFIATHCPGLDVIAHNAPFDRGVLCDDLERAGEMSDAWPRWRWRDSVTLARQVIPGLPTYSLHDNDKGAGLASRLGLPKGGHRAMGDVRTTAALMVELRRRAQKPWGEWAGDAHVWGVGVVKAARAKPTATQQVQPTKRTSRGARSVDAVDAADAAPVVADLFARRSA